MLARKLLDQCLGLRVAGLGVEQLQQQDNLLQLLGICLGVAAESGDRDALVGVGVADAVLGHHAQKALPVLLVGCRVRPGGAVGEQGEGGRAAAVLSPLRKEMGALPFVPSSTSSL